MIDTKKKIFKNIAYSSQNDFSSIKIFKQTLNYFITSKYEII